MRIFTSSARCKTFRTKKLVPRNDEEAPIFHRLGLVPGYSQEKMERLRVVVVGAGGLGTQLCSGLARKGVGALDIFDYDRVELSNLSRQDFFKEDLGKNKAVACARNTARQAVGNSVITGHPWTIQEAVRDHHVPVCDVVVVLVDNDGSREFCSQYFKVPVIFGATSIDARRCYAMVQEVDKACIRCVVPRVDESKMPCVLPSCVDINKATVALALYAIDSLFMEKRTRYWNYREHDLTGELKERSDWFNKDPDCPLCGRR